MRRFMVNELRDILLYEKDRLSIGYFWRVKWRRASGLARDRMTTRKLSEPMLRQAKPGSIDPEVCQAIRRKRGDAGQNRSGD